MEYPQAAQQMRIRPPLPPSETISQTMAVTDQIEVSLQGLRDERDRLNKEIEVIESRLLTLVNRDKIQPADGSAKPRY